MSWRSYPGSTMNPVDYETTPWACYGCPCVGTAQVVSFIVVIGNTAQRSRLNTTH